MVNNPNKYLENVPLGELAMQLTERVGLLCAVGYLAFYGSDSLTVLEAPESATIVSYVTVVGAYTVATMRDYQQAAKIRFRSHT